MFDYVVETAQDIGRAKINIGILGAIGGPYLQAVAIMKEVYKKFNNSPFKPAFESAVTTGEYLAELIIANFEGHFVNLLGYSLGTELIKNLLLRLSQKNCLHMVNKVYFIGGVSDLY
jgi:hypothetical protein